MRDEYDFSKARRAALVSGKGKTRITIYIDDDVLDEFRARAEQAGKGYQTLVNDALRSYLDGSRESPLTATALRRILREELTMAPSRKRSGGGA
jgi:hypothetical protein